MRVINIEMGGEHCTAVDEKFASEQETPSKRLQFAATIGFFDGVHRGHRFLLECLLKEARKRNMRSMAVTFDKHPRQVVQSSYVPQLLTTLDDKLRLLATTGIDTVAVLHFTPEMAEMSAPYFMSGILKKRLGVGTLIMGYDNHFGKGAQGTFDECAAYGKKIGVDVLMAEALGGCDGNISSSMVRRRLVEGNVREANRCLGYRYNIKGVVVKGLRLGREMGFPTANIRSGSDQILIPKNGVYAVVVALDGCDRRLFGMMNIGGRLTFGVAETSIEVNIFDFSEDVYGRKITVEFIDRLRDDKKFDSMEALAAQLKTDELHAKELIERNEENKNKGL